MKSLYIVIPILITLMFGLGLELRLRDFKQVFANPKALLAGFFAQMVLLPLAAFGICIVLNIDPIFAVGLVLIACCPGGSSSNALTMVAKGDTALSVSLTAMVSFISVLSVPLVMGFSMSYFLSSESQIKLSFLRTFIHSLVVVILPVAMGMLLNAWKGGTALKISALIRRSAIFLLIIMIAFFIYKQFPKIVSNLKELLLSVFLLLAMTMSLGKVISLLLRLKSRQERAIIIEVGIQNAAYAITIAVSPMLLANETIAIPAIIYAVVMNIFVFGYVGGLKVFSPS